MKALLFLVLFPLAGAVLTDSQLVESHIPNERTPLFNLRMDKGIILCSGILIADHQILFRATCVPKLPPHLKGLFARALSGRRFYPEKLLLRSGFTNVEEQNDEYAILYLHLNPASTMVQADILHCALDEDWGAAVYGRNKLGHSLKFYELFSMNPGGYVVSEEVSETELIVDGVLFHHEYVMGFAKNVYKMNFGQRPENMYFTQLDTQWTYHALKSHPVNFAESYSFEKETEETEQREAEEAEEKENSYGDIDRWNINFEDKYKAILFVQHIKEIQPICMGVSTGPYDVFISEACAKKFVYDPWLVTVRYILARRSVQSLYRHPDFPNYFVLKLQQPLEGDIDFFEIATNVSPETVSDGAAIGYNKDWDYYADYVQFKSYYGSYLYSASMRKTSDVLVDGIFVRHGQLIGFFEDQNFDGNVMSLKIISALPCADYGQITAPVTALPEETSSSQSDCEEED